MFNAELFKLIDKASRITINGHVVTGIVDDYMDTDDISAPSKVLISDIGNIWFQYEFVNQDVVVLDNGRCIVKEGDSPNSRVRIEFVTERPIAWEDLHVPSDAV